LRADPVPARRSRSVALKGRRTVAFAAGIDAGAGGALVDFPARRSSSS